MINLLESSALGQSFLPYAITLVLERKYFLFTTLFGETTCDPARDKDKTFEIFTRPGPLALGIWGQ